MTQVHILAIDLAKRSFQVCETDRGGRFYLTGFSREPAYSSF